jgi:phosphatidylserine decarboxylase
LLQAKGRDYSLADLLGSEADARICEGGYAWTIYLSPRDYHRVHAPERCTLAGVRRIPGTRYSVAPGVLARRLVLPVNERAVFHMDTARGPLFLVMVGATNVGRIRVVDESARRGFARGEDMARFEMGSTVVLIAPPEVATPAASIAPGVHVRLGEALASWTRSAGAQLA